MPGSHFQLRIVDFGFVRLLKTCEARDNKPIPDFPSHSTEPLLQFEPDDPCSNRQSTIQNPQLKSAQRD